MRRALATGLLLAACAPIAPTPPPPPQPVQVASATDVHDCRRDWFTASEHGVSRSSPIGEQLTAHPARLLREDGGTPYFFDLARPILMTVDRDGARRVLELPPLEHPGFPSSDPLAFLQKDRDLSITAGVLCLDLHDRLFDPELTYNIRADLATGALERHLVEDLTGDRCGSEREALRPRLCTPTGPSANRDKCVSTPIGPA